MIYLRKYRDQHWGHLFSIQHDSDGRDIWIVEFPDGCYDAWPSWDQSAGYQVRVQIEAP